MSSESEFGRGYVTCLAQFANHSERLDEYKTMFMSVDPVVMWLNGSSDHLYELKRPRRGVPQREWLTAKSIAADALDIGHGFHGRKTTEREARTLIRHAVDLVTMVAVREGVGYPMSIDDCLELDRKLGLKPEGGQWACPENFKR